MSGRAGYSTWQAMLSRCCDPRDVGYKNYGGRGIAVCERWVKSFDAFLEDMGPRPAGHSIERMNNDGDYCPENCRWATQAEQNRNMRTNVRLTYGGETMCITDWARRLGIKRRTLSSRLANGWSVDATLNTPIVAQTNKKSKSSRPYSEWRRLRNQPSEAYRQDTEMDFTGILEGYDANREIERLVRRGA